MKNEITINTRVFPVMVVERLTGEEKAVTFPVTKEMLQAAMLTGQSSNELLERLLDRRGFTVVDIGKPRKVPVIIDLGELTERWMLTHSDLEDGDA